MRVCLCVFVFERTNWCVVREVEDGDGGRGQENHSSQSEENKVSQGSRPRPQEFWDK